MLKDSADRVHCGACLCCRFAGDHPIIGIPRELIPSQAHLPIEWRQENVTEDGRNHTPLGSTALTGKEPPFAVASCLEHRLDKAKHSAVRHSLGYEGEKLLMVGTDFFYDDLRGLRDALVESLAQMRVDFQMPLDLFVFSSHQGYIFHFFRTTEGDDPPVYGFSEVDPTVRQKWPTFSDALLGFAEGSR